MKKVLLSFILLVSTFSCFATDYYFNNSGNVEVTSSWGVNSDGTGANPADFTSNNNTFIIGKTSLTGTITLNANWTVSGTNSKVIVGNGSDFVELDITGGTANFTIDVVASNTLKFSGGTYTAVTLGILSTNSTVNYNQNGQTIKIANYGNLRVSDCTFPTGTIGIANNLTKADFGGGISVTAGSIINFNGSAAQTIPAINLYGGDTYLDVIFSNTGAKSFEDRSMGDGRKVRINGKLSVQGVSVAGTAGVDWGNAATAILEYKPADGINITTGPEWPAIIGTNDLMRGGVTIDALGTTGTVTLNQAKSMLDGFGGYVIGLRLTAVGKLITNNYTLSLAGDFIRAAGSVFTAGSSQMEFVGGTTPTNIAGFTTTGLVLFAKSNQSAIVNITGRIPESGIGTFPITVACTMVGNNGTEYADLTEINFKNGTSSFHTSGTLTLTKGRLFLHRSLVNHDINTTNGGSPQINQCGNFVMNSSTVSNASLSYCSNVSDFSDQALNVVDMSILRVSGDFTKTGGVILVNGGPAFNGTLEFIGINQNMSNDIYGRLYQTTFKIKSGSTVTFTSDIIMNGGYLQPGTINPLYASWENFFVESGGTLNFSTFRILGGQGFEARAGSTIITSHAEGFYDGANDAGNTLGCIRTDAPNSTDDQTAPNVFTSITNFKRRFFSNDASYIFSGAGNQNTGLFGTFATNTSAGASTKAVRNLGFNKTSSTDVVTAIQEFIVNGELQQTNGIFAYTQPANPQLTLNGTVTGTLGCIRGSVLNDLIIGNTGTGGTGNLGTLYFDQSTPGVSVGSGAANDLTALSQGTTNVLRRLNVTRSNGTTSTIGNYLQISNVVTPTSGTIVSNGNLVILSNASTTGSILALGAGASITGNVVVQSYFAGSANLTNRGFRMISSPIVDEAYPNNYFKQIYNRFIVTCASWPASNCDYRPVAAPYAQTLQSYLELGTAGTSSFGHLNPESAAERGRGYYFFFRGSRNDLNEFTPGKINVPFTVPDSWTATYIGTINSGTFTSPVTFTNNGETTLDGLNILGNPYPSTLDMQTFLNDNSGVIANFLSIMRPNRTGFVTSSGDIVNNYGNNLLLGETPVAGNSSIRFIQPGQGFFVKATSSGNVTFNEAQKAAESNVPATHRLLSTGNESEMQTNTTKAKPAQRKLIRITLNNKETQEQATIVLESGNDPNYSGYDAPYQSNSSISLSTLTADGKKACINFMPEVSEVKEVKMYINSGTDSNLKFTFDDLIGAGDYDVLLKDNYNNTLTKIKSIKDTINFEVNKIIPATLGSDRFALQFYGKNVLPIQVSDFKLVAQGNAILLTWNTLSEQNAKNIIVQRSTDGINFIDIKTVDVQGNSNQTLNYGYLDKNAEVGTVYYRLQKNDIDGTFKYTDVKSVIYGLDKENELVIFPSPVPVGGHLNVRYKNNQPVNITIYDITGKIVKSFKNISTENFKTNLSGVSAGIYILKLNNKKSNVLIAENKFIKL